MSLKKNIVANYVSQFSMILIGLLMMPQYIKYMGTEAYGLVGLYMMLQAWMQLLDMGMTPTLIRETARFRGGNISRTELKQLFRTLETIFLCIASSAALAAFLFSGLVAASWLKVEHIPLSTVQLSLLLIALAVTLRWVSSLYRGIITGFERLVWLSTYNICIAVARFILVIFLLIGFDNGPVTFFSFQLLISISEIIVLRTKASALYQRKKTDDLFKDRLFFFHWPTLQGVLKFSSTIAFTTSIWAVATQSDKLLLSKLLTLTDYAYFTLATMASGGIAILGSTAGTALMPRFSKLSAENKHEEIIILYRTATRFIGAVTIPATLALAFFAEPILFAWTGDAQIAAKTAPVLTLYSLGNGILVFNAFPYYLQYATGDLKLHFFGSILFILLFLPTLIFLTLKLGIIGAGWSWFSINLVSFVLWVSFLHHYLCPGLHLKWLFNDIGISLLYCTPFVVALNYFIKWDFSRVHTGLAILLICLTLIMSTLIPLLFSRYIKNTTTREQLKKFFGTTL